MEDTDKETINSINFLYPFLAILTYNFNLSTDLICGYLKSSYLSALSFPCRSLSRIARPLISLNYFPLPKFAKQFVRQKRAGRVTSFHGLSKYRNTGQYLMQLA